MRKFNWIGSVAAGAVLMLGGTVAVDAGSINYGDFFGPPLPAGITFSNVTESSGTDPVPLYGAPHTVSNGLDFDPQGFVASATGGTQDITDGQLNYTILGTVSPSGTAAVNNIFVSEGGDYTLAGVGTAATQDLAGVILHVKVDEVDGVAITPINFSQNASVGFNLLTNPGLVQPWSVSLSVPISAELTALNVPYMYGATKVEIVIDNQLLALSEPGSVAFIDKKDFVSGLVTDITGMPAPEPTTIATLSLSLFGLLGRRRNRD